MKIGVQLPVQSQSRLYVEDWELEAGPDEIARVATLADRLGFFYVGVCDHTAIPEDRVDRMGDVWYEPLTTLAWLAGITEQVRLLTHVYVLPMRPALLAAKGVATLDRISDGRVILGVGAGHVEAEFDAVGADFTGRGSVLDQRIDEVREALSGSYDGLAVAPRPVQGPVPIWVGGSSEAALRRVAERGDGWLPQGTRLEDMPEAIDLIRRTAKDAGRDPDRIEIGGMPLPLYVGEPSWDVGRWTRTGSGEELAGHLREFADLGCSHAQVRLRSRSVDELCEQLEVFVAEVVPLLGAS